MSEDPQISSSPEGTQQRPGAERLAVDVSTAGVPQSTVAATGKRQAFRDIRRQIEEEDLGSPGVQKMLLDDLERAESECEILQGYIERYHEADKRSAVLEERLRTQTAVEIFFGVGVGLGGTILGLAPVFWDTQPQGALALVVGLILVIGATIGRVMKR